jgi:hypothetical protein
MKGDEIVSTAAALERMLQDEAFSLLKSKSEYDAARELIDLAADVGRIAARIRTALSSDGPAASASKPPPPAASVGRARKSTSTYPRFFVSDGRLVKLGKGKQKTAKEYRHEATRKSFDAVCAWIDQRSALGQKTWAAAEADRELTPKGVPAYQVYLVIAALKEIGALSQVARGHYSVARTSDSCEDWWQSLEMLDIPTSSKSTSGPLDPVDGDQ